MEEKIGSGKGIWSRDFVLLFGIHFLVSTTFYLLLMTMAGYAMDRYGASGGMAGAAASTYIVGALVARVVFGGKIDRWGVKRSLIAGLVANAIASLLYFADMGLAPLLVLRFVHGLGFGLANGAAVTGAGLVLPRERCGEGMGYFSIAQSIAMGLGPFLAALLVAASGGYAALLGVSLAAATMALLCVSFVRIPSVSVGEKSPSRRLGLVGSFVYFPILQLACVLAVTMFCYSGILSFLSSYADSIDLAVVARFYFLAYVVASLATRPAVGRRLDRAGEGAISVLAFCSLVVGFLLLASAANGAMLLLSGALVGVGNGSLQSIVQTEAVRTAAASELGRANSTIYLGMDLGMGIGPIAIGSAAAAFGYRIVYAILAGLCIVAYVVYRFARVRFSSDQR